MITEIITSGQRKQLLRVLEDGNDQPEIFPTGKYTVSFDEKDALWKDADGNHRVPSVRRDSDGDWFSWRSDNVLVCFCDLD